MKKVLKFKRISSIFIAFIFVNAAGCVCAQEIIEQQSGITKKSALYQPNVIIIKFNDHSPLGSMVREVFEKGDDFHSVSEGTILDEINQKYHIKTIKNLIKNKMSIEKIKKKFPKRSKRIPKSAKEPPKPSLIYKITFDNNVEDVEDICRELEKDPNIQYAHPNRIVSIYK